MYVYYMKTNYIFLECRHFNHFVSFEFDEMRYTNNVDLDFACIQMQQRLLVSVYHGH